MQSKRVTRFRIDDSSAGNSVNPSPKKQPRLNLPTSKDGQWNGARAHASDDGSLRKRSKVGDGEPDDKHSLSDIQFIDSITPEHTITAATTVFASAQVHNPPSSKRSSILAETPIEAQLRRLSADKTEHKEGRFSYPGMGAKFCDDKKIVSRFSMHADGHGFRHGFGDGRSSMRASMHRTNETAGNVRGSDSDFSKISIPTPSSPSKSPCYSLLAGTSSENSSSLNTPIFDMDMSSATQQFDQRLDELKSIGRSAARDMLCMQSASETQSILSNASNQSERRKDLSLDLDKSKMSVDDTSPLSNKHNTPNLTQTSGSTSQSMTPSEFGYHHLNRPSIVVSLDNSPRSDIYEAVEQVYRSNCDAHTLAATPVQSLPPINKARSPIKATINITYNLKSPQRNSIPTHFAFAEPDQSQFPDYEPVEVVGGPAQPAATFDDNAVYEQVKFFKGAVSEVNHLLKNGNNGDVHPGERHELADLNAAQVVPSPVDDARPMKGDHRADTEPMDNKSDSGDVLMPDQELGQDGLDFDPQLSMYENVQVRKPPNTYENVTMRSSGKTKSLNFTETNLSLGKENSKPANFSVKQLANKFETSPVEAMAPYDFSKPFVRKHCDTNRNSISAPKAAKNAPPPPPHLDKSNVFTRSLDENAFVREFGSTRSPDGVDRGAQPMPVAANVLTENSPLRRAPSHGDSAALKSANAAKRMAQYCDTDGDLCKSDVAPDAAPKSGAPVIPAADAAPVAMEQTGEPTKAIAGDDDRGKILGSVILDRQRIERIKEERRHQLNEKFRSESFKNEKENTQIKSKSRNELYDIRDADKKTIDMMQYKSKSRTEIYNARDADLCVAKNSSIERLVQFAEDKKPKPADDDGQSVALRTKKFDRLNLQTNGSAVTLRSLSQ